MKKTVLILIAILMKLSLNAQEIGTSYFPEYNNEVSKAKYNKGLEYLKNSYKQIIEDKNKEPYYIHYWNVAIAYSIMQVEKETVWEYLKTSKSLNRQNFCIIVNTSIEAKKGLENMSFFKFLGDEFSKFISDCDGIKNSPATVEEKLKRKADLDLSKLNEDLIDKLIMLSDKDQRYRHQISTYHENWEEQTRLDKEIQEEMVAILEHHGYPGRDLVGEPFMNWSCMFIEHFLSIEYQEKYLSIVVEAYHNKQLEKNYLAMLIDRIHSKNTGKQIFGSHIDVPFESPEELVRIKSKYGLE